MNEPDQNSIRDAVRETYGDAARGGGCCGSTPVSIDSARLGYSDADLGAIPEGADLGLGCGNPQAIAGLKPGETVLDLGSGAGFDCFLAARAVGDGGHIIGVDMTPEMLAKARENARRGDYRNVEFRLGEIEHLPVADASIDVIISNCVINLSPHKEQVFHEAFRVLRPGGRLAVSDVVASAEIPEQTRRDLALHTSCIAGARPVDELETMLRDAGFDAIRIAPQDKSREFIRDWAPGHEAEAYVVSASMEAIKPEVVTP
ncbi:MAG: arsenite methyltransferase [Gammaproteobacteria bacterium]|nr:arsenite methyltransferase [Gammaproteobacteria bacterium]